MAKKISVFLMIIGIIGICFGIIYFYNGYIKPSQNINEMLETWEKTGVVEIIENYPERSLVDNNALKKINPDYIGWLYISGTKISQPIVQGDDNAFYLTHDYKKDKNPLGSVFLDNATSSDFSGNNSIVYGHAIPGTKGVFTNLLDFRKKSVFENNQYIYIYINDKVEIYKIYSAYIANVEDITFNTSFNNEKNFEKFLSFTQEKNMYERDISFGAESTIITLSTCTEETGYTTFSKRFVVHGIKI